MNNLNFITKEMVERTGFRSQQQSQMKELSGFAEVNCRECEHIILKEQFLKLDAPYLSYDDGINSDIENTELGYLVKLNITCPNCNVFIENGFVHADKVYFEE